MEDLTNPQVSQADLQQILSKNLPKYQSLEDFIDALENSTIKQDEHRRKTHGIFFTPKRIVELILNEMEFPSSNSNQAPRLLDLSCGTGHFLGEGLRRMHQHFLQQGLPAMESAHRAAQCIEGVEVESVSRNIARIFLLGIFHGFAKKTHSSAMDLPELAIHQQDCLMDDLNYLSQGTGTWDFLILNPPYVTQKGEQNAPKISSRYAKILKTQFESLNPQIYKDRWGIDVPGHLKINLLVPFIERAIKLLAPHGRLGFIVHKNFLDVGSYWPLRHFILETCEIRKIIDLSMNAFPEITGETVVLVLEKKPSRITAECDIMITPQWNGSGQPDSGTGRSRFKISQQRFRETFQESFLIYPREDHYILRDRIWQFGPAVKLGTVATLSSFGINVPRASESTLAEHPDWVPAIRGRDIGRYYLQGATRVVDFTPDALTRNGRAALFAAPIKIVMQRVGPHLQACIDLEQRVCFNSTNIIVPHAPDVNFAKYLLALLNCSLIDAYYKLFLSNQNVLTVNVTQAKLAELPVVLPTSSQQKGMVELVEEILHKQERSDELDYGQQIDNQVAEIYHLSTADLATLRML